MLIMTTWKTRPNTPEASKRMMATWGQQLERHTKDPVWKELWFYIHTDGSGGASLAEVPDTEVAGQRAMQLCMELSEFLEIDMKPVLNQEQAMPAVIASQATIVG